MKITIPYTPDFSIAECQVARAEEVRALCEKVIMKELEKIARPPEATLLYICFHVDLPIKTITASMVVLTCIQKRFPEYKPKAMFINTLPSPALAIDIEFANFRDIGRAFA